MGTASDSGAEGGDGGGMEEGELIPWPKGTVKVDVSDVYDWYKLGQHISNLKGLGKHDFGKGPPQTVMAFGSEPLEHEYIKDLNKIGLKTYDIDEDVTEGADISNQIEISLQVNQDSTIDVTAMLDGEEVGHVNFDDSEGELIPQDLYVDPEYRGQGIAAAMYNYTKSKGYRILRGEEQTDDAIGLWNKHRPGKDIWEQGVAEGLTKQARARKEAESVKAAIERLEQQLKDPNPHIDKDDIRRRLETEKSRLELYRDVLDEQVVAKSLDESLDSPYSYHWEEGDFGDLNAYAKLSDNTVLDIEFEQTNVDKSQWNIGFQRDGQIHKTGKGDEQRVFATVLSAIKEFIENKQPKEVFFSAEKSKVNPESRKRLYDRLVQKYATALGYQASQSDTSEKTIYKLLRIGKQGMGEGNNNLNFEEGDCPIFAIALHRLSKLPLMALVEYDEEMGRTVLIHAYVKLNDEWRVDASGETNVPYMLAKFPNNGAAEEVQISEKDLIKLGYGKNKCPALSEVLPHAKEVLQEIGQGVAENNLTEFAPGPDFRDDDDRQAMSLLEFAEIIKLFLGSEYTMIDRKTPEQVSVKFDPKDRTSGHNGAVLYSIVGKKQNEYPTVNFQLIDYEQGPQVGRGRRAGVAILKTRTNALKIADIIYNTMGLPKQDRRVEENFADGKNPGRKGLAKRMGVPTKASVTRLRQIAKNSTGEKQRMAHWMANMKAGKRK